MCVKPHPLGTLYSPRTILSWIVEQRYGLEMAGNLLAYQVMVSVNRLFLCIIRQLNLGEW